MRSPRNKDDGEKQSKDDNWEHRSGGGGGGENLFAKSP